MNSSKTPKWKFRGGQLSLDFVNSVDGRVELNGNDYTILKDKINNYEDLVDWAKTIGILNETTARNLVSLAGQKGKVTNRVFERAIKLRESLYRIFISIVENRVPLKEDIEVLNNECSAVREQQKLVYTSRKFSWNYELTDEPDNMIWQVALSGAELLLSDQLKRVKQCPGTNCGWLFLDASKNGSRQWCDMKDCGNVAKVRRYREKRKSE
jgi:predicted RNA-binding Zn ribbon-like protein